MVVYAAVDSNALTYLVNAIGVEGYDPAQDNSGLADERVAMARLFMYGDCKLWVPPVVRTETADIPAGELRDAQNRMTWYQLLDHDSGVSETVIDRRVNELLRHHNGVNDCRLLPALSCSIDQVAADRIRERYVRKKLTFVLVGATRKGFLVFECATLPDTVGDQLFQIRRRYLLDRFFSNHD